MNIEDIISKREIFEKEHHLNIYSEITKNIGVNKLGEILDYASFRLKIGGEDIIYFLNLIYIFGEKNAEKIIDYIKRRNRKTWIPISIEIAKTLREEGYPIVKNNFSKSKIMEIWKEQKAKTILKKLGMKIPEDPMAKVSNILKKRLSGILEEDEIKKILDYFVIYPEDTIKAIKIRNTLLENISRDHLINGILSPVTANIGRYKLVYNPKDIFLQMFSHIKIPSCHSPGRAYFKESLGKISNPYMNTIVLLENENIVSRIDTTWGITIINGNLYLAFAITSPVVGRKIDEEILQGIKEIFEELNEKIKMKAVYIPTLNPQSMYVIIPSTGYDVKNDLGNTFKIFDHEINGRENRGFIVYEIE